MKSARNQEVTSFVREWDSIFMLSPSAELRLTADEWMSCRTIAVSVATRHTLQDVCVTEPWLTSESTKGLCVDFEGIICAYLWWHQCLRSSGLQQEPHEKYLSVRSFCLRRSTARAGRCCKF
jgi:hypothetical protein